MKYVTLSTSIVLATIAAYFSIAGLTTLFAGAFWSVVVMASALEIGKLVTAAYLHLEWKEISRLIRVYLVLAVGILMLITSMGIFGYLSKAHLEQNTERGNNDLQLEQIDDRIGRQRKIIRDAERVIQQLDGSVETLMEFDRIRGNEGALAVRNSQKQERDALNQQIDEAYREIEFLQAKASPLRQKQINLESEIGPLKYIAELIYGETYDVNNAIRMVILLLVVVFDPLAVVLLIVSTDAFKRDRLNTISKGLVDSQQIMVMK